MLETNTLLQNRYLIEKQIGEGGMGAVYLAIDQRFGSPVAIKETFFKNDELGEAFEREARLLNSLHHPALPHVSDYFAENNGYFLVMQYIEGEDVLETLNREGAFPIKDVLRWTETLLDALDYLHSQVPPIIHRDIKPQNLKITARGDVVLLDFGLAKLSSEDPSGMKSIFGYSRKYSPLEQIQGTGTDVRSDIFSLAATAYHLLTGKPPVEVIARASAIIQGDPDPLRLASEIDSKVPVIVAEVLNSALALNAAKRFVSAKAMRLAFEHAINIIPVENSAELTKPISTVAAVDNQIVKSAKIENFAALESFAAESANDLPETNDTGKLPVVIPISNAVFSSSAPEVVSEEDYSGNSATNVVPPTKPARFRFAVLAALLVCSVLAASYFVKNKNSSSEPDQDISETISNAAQPEVVLETPKPEITDAALPENTEPVKTKSSSVTPTVKKKETADKTILQTEKTITPNSAPPVPEISRTTSAKTSKQNESPNRPQTRPRVVDNRSSSDIESIFTGNPSGSREIRNREGEEMSEEEFQELRRQRRQERRQRQNRNIIPN